MPTLPRTETCPSTGLRFQSCDPTQEGASQGTVVLLNGIGLDHEGFTDFLESLGGQVQGARFPYLGYGHMAVTAPGFEPPPFGAHAPLFMAEQASRIGRFLDQVLPEGRPVVLYAFSFGSDLAVDLLLRQGAMDTWMPQRVVLTELNVRPESCFITSRIAAAWDRARVTGADRGRVAYQGFVSEVLKASTEGRLSAALMDDMTKYFAVIKDKDWAQLAHSAREASSDPVARVRALLAWAAAHPQVRVDLVFSDPGDLEAFAALAREAPGGDLHLFDASRHGHFHHMRRRGVFENLCAALREVPLG